MTVSSIEPVNNYAGNNSATKFDFDFYIENEEELLVQHTNKAGYQTTLKLNTDYTISKIGSESGGYIIFPAQDSSYKVLQEDELITLSLNLKIVQEKEFKNSSKLNLNMLENALDYVTRLIQILNRKMERAVKVKEGINIAPDRLMENINDAVNKSLTYSTYSEDSSKTAQKSAELAKNWAVKDNDKVENIDYSSKYYAQKSKASAEISEEKAQETNQTYLTAKEDIENKKSEFIYEIEQEGDKQFKRIQSMGFYQKDGRIFYLNELGEETSIQFDKTDNLFDVVQKDHQLTFKDTKGLALLGSYVYKESDDSGIYGYPDFYNKCLEEYKAEDNEKENIYVSSNIAGAVNNSKGFISGFSAANYAETNKKIILENVQDNWEIVLKVKMPAVAAACAIIGSGAGSQKFALSLRTTTANLLNLYLSGNGTSWNIANAAVSTSVFELGREYLIKISYLLTGEPENQTAIYNVDLSPIDKINWTNFIKKEITQISSATAENTYKIADFTPSLGIDNNVVFTGSIDLNKSYIKIKDDIVWTGVNEVETINNKNGHRFYNINDKGSIDEIYKETGFAWYYGIDEENKRILLPQMINRYLVEKKEPTEEDSTWYNLYSDGWCEQGGVTVSTTSIPIYFSKPYKSKNYDVSVTCINKATSDQNISINNRQETGFTLLDSESFEHIWYAQGYAAAPVEQSYNYMVVGNTAIQKAQSEYTQISMAASDTLPLFTAIYFDFKPNHASWLKAGTLVNRSEYKTAYDELVKVLKGEETKYGSEFKVIKENEKLSYFDYSEYWVVDEDTQTFRTPLKTSFEKNIITETIGLYFKVANAIQNIQILDVGKVNQTLNDIGAMTMRECAVVVRAEKTGTSECRIWSDGYIEQSGLITRDAVGGVQIYFLYPFKNKNYRMDFTQETLETYTTKTGSYSQPYITEKNKESVYVCCQSAIAQIGYIRWCAKGYINTVV